MHTKTVILFDLDGTLTDPARGITGCIAFALAHFGIAVPDLTALNHFIGPPLASAFREMGISEGDITAAIAKYRERFGSVGLYENIPYPGTHEALRALREAGKILAVATSKPWVYAQRILEHFGLAEHFAFIGGSELDNSRTDKAEVIAYTLEQLGNPGLDTVCMVGDREHDVAGAAALGIPCVGVLWGYGARDELEHAGAATLADNIAALRQIFGV